MPIYEYVCKSCGKTVELMQKAGDPEPTCCGNYGPSENYPIFAGQIHSEEKMQRVISKTSFQLKGGGWYKQGYTKGRK